MGYLQPPIGSKPNTKGCLLKFCLTTALAKEPRRPYLRQQHRSLCHVDDYEDALDLTQSLKDHETRIGWSCLWKAQKHMVLQGNTVLEVRDMLASSTSAGKGWGGEWAMR